MTVQNLTLKTQIRFPSRVSGSGAIVVTKSAGIWTIKLDPSVLSDVVPAQGNWPNDKIIYWDSAQGTFNTISISEILSLLQASPTPTVISTSGTSTVGNSDQLIVLNLQAPSTVTLNLPAVASRSPVGLPLEIYDFTGLATTTTLVPHGTEKIMGANTSWIMTSGSAAQTGSVAKLIPSTTMGGWLLR